jgi:hypothetical protein
VQHPPQGNLYPLFLYMFYLLFLAVLVTLFLLYSQGVRRMLSVDLLNLGRVKKREYPTRCILAFSLYPCEFPIIIRSRFILSLDFSSTYCLHFRGSIFLVCIEAKGIGLRLRHTSTVRSNYVYVHIFELFYNTQLSIDQYKIFTFDIVIVLCIT